MKKLSIKDFLQISQDIYSVPNDRLYDLEDLFYYQEKWLLRHIDYMENKQETGAVDALTASVAWFSAITNRLHVDLQYGLKKRYPYKCPYCLQMPCVCEGGSGKKPKKTGRPTSRTPESVEDWQEVVGKIYPPQAQRAYDYSRALRQEDRLHEACRNFRRSTGKHSFKQVEVELVDYLAELLKIFDNIEKSLSSEFSERFLDGCYVCHKAPCECNYIE